MASSRQSSRRREGSSRRSAVNPQGLGERLQGQYDARVAPLMTPWTRAKHGARWRFAATSRRALSNEFEEGRFAADDERVEPGELVVILRDSAGARTAGSGSFGDARRIARGVTAEALVVRAVTIPGVGRSRARPGRTGGHSSQTSRYAGASLRAVCGDAAFWLTRSLPLRGKNCRGPQRTTPITPKRTTC